MKTLGRIFIILFAFVLLSGLMVTAVNASGMNQPNFNGSGERTEFRPQGQGAEEGGLPFRPDGERSEGREHGGPSGGRWMFGAIKNVGVVAVLVTVIAWPRSVAKKKKRVTATP